MVSQIGGISFPAPRFVSTSAPRVNSPTAAAPQPSTRVTLSSASDEINAIYTMSAKKLQAPLAAGSSPLEQQMSANLNKSVSGAFQGLGKALLSQLQESPKGFSNAVTSSQVAGLASSADQSSAVALDIVTQSGAKVSVTLSRQQGGLVAEVQTSGGELTDKETAAIAKLGDAFQTALDGLSATTPAVNIDGLTGFDTSVLKSVDLNTDMRQGSESIQSLNYQSDLSQRALSYKDSSLSFQLSTDLTHPELLGTQGQQIQALASYDKQLNAASNRGQGDNASIATFKSAFHALNSHYGSNDVGSSQKTIMMGTADQARTYLSGLADFTASFQQTAVSSNPMKSGEKDSFSYDFSQASRISTASDGNPSKIVQSNRAHLQASYHLALDPSIPLALTMLSSSQNYTYHQINDDSTSETTLDFKKGNLASVTTSQATHNKEEVKKYSASHLISDISTPYDKEETHKTDLIGDNIHVKPKAGKKHL